LVIINEIRYVVYSSRLRELFCIKRPHGLGGTLLGQASVVHMDVKMDTHSGNGCGDTWELWHLVISCLMETPLATAVAVESREHMSLGQVVAKVSGGTAGWLCLQYGTMMQQSVFCGLGEMMQIPSLSQCCGIELR
jgi:hypothetical protein